HIYLSAISFLLPTHPHTRALHSFPTRRSSDLRKEQARARAHEHTGDFRKLTQYLQHVRAKGHVRNQPGLKIAVAQERNLPQKVRSEEHTSELQSPDHLVCRLLLEKKKTKKNQN